MAAPGSPRVWSTAPRTSRARPETAARLAKQSLLAIARRELARAGGSPVGSSVRVIETGSATAPRVAVAAIKAGEGLDVGEEAAAWCLHVLVGRIRARQATVTAAAYPGDLLTGTSGWHIHADQDAAWLVVTTQPHSASPS